MRKHGCLISTIVIFVGFATLMASFIVIKNGDYELIEISETLMHIAIALVVIGLIWAFLAYFQQKEDMEIDARIKLDTDREKANKEIETHEMWLSERYTINKHIYCYVNNSLLSVAVDFSNKVLIIDQEDYQFNEIIGSELITSESIISTTTIQNKNSIGRAIVGGVIAGGAGAIVGAATAKERGTTQTHSYTSIDGVYIYLSDVLNPMIALYGDESFNRDVFATVQAITSRNKSKRYGA